MFDLVKTNQKENIQNQLLSAHAINHIKNSLPAYIWNCIEESNKSQLDWRYYVDTSLTQQCDDFNRLANDLNIVIKNIELEFNKYQVHNANEITKLKKPKPWADYSVWNPYLFYKRSWSEPKAMGRYTWVMKYPWLAYCFSSCPKWRSSSIILN